jgi:hypothetical protein
MHGDSTTIRPGHLSERDALERLQRRSSMHGPMYRAQLAAHPEGVELLAEQIAAGLVRVAEQGEAQTRFGPAPRMSLPVAG